VDVRWPPRARRQRQVLVVVYLLGLNDAGPHWAGPEGTEQTLPLKPFVEVTVIVLCHWALIDRPLWKGSERLKFGWATAFTVRDGHVHETNA